MTISHFATFQWLARSKISRFFNCFTRETAGRLANDLVLRHCQLPDELCREINAIRVKSRSELGFNESSEEV
jgi:hypothetical protein